MKIGLYGGTFDPVHIGHIKIAQAAVKQFELDELWFIPAKIPPHKVSSVVAGETDRLNMLKLAVEKESKAFKICMYELEQENISYSFLTLKEFKRLYPENNFLFIIGEDSLVDFEKWKNPDIISNLVELVVVPRFNNDLKNIHYLSDVYKQKYNAKIYILDFPIVDISSTEIRNALSNKENVLNYICEDVYKYIVDNNLYM